MKTDKVLVEKFIKFLEENNALQEYLKELDQMRGYDSIEEFTEDMDARTFIGSAFPWMITDKGRAYWYELDKKWLNTL